MIDHNKTGNLDEYFFVEQLWHNILQLFQDHKLFNYAQIHFDRGRGGLPSKWYQPDLNGDGLSDFVLFGVGQDHVSECGLDKCGDEWMREPIFLIRTSEKTISGN